MVFRLRLAVAGALLCLPAAVSTAHADATDDKFLAALNSAGIGDQTSTAHAIDAGHFVCVRLDNGSSPAEVEKDVETSSSMPQYHAGFFVAASVHSYCPRHRGELGG
jgi:hypothetical protein